MIPSIDLNDFVNGNEEQKHAFVSELGKAFNEIGFVAVKNHGLTSELSDELYKAYQKFFALPQEIKSKYEIPNGAGQRGYTGKGKETAKGFKTPDLKEFYHTGQENKPKEAELSIHYPDNVWPVEIPELSTISIKTFKILEQAGIQLLRAIALYLHLESDYFDEKVATGNSILRAIHYFPIENPTFEKEEAVRAAAHEDINLITLLMGASADGLQIQKKDGSWVAVTALPDQIVVNVGDMLARLTNDILKSTTHRVVNPPKELMHLPRYSMPFFMHPRADMDLTCLPQCIKIENPKHYTDMTAGEFLDERLRELGLKK
ncbi:MAG: 2-oxoglutarate and iron-dependent oxygenase domain-containing protein [Bacteroidota bacterium]|nr:2-oxoglutarate and iron-dependent oxygenase domain-containing protein [Bacteroidota bacterium]